MTGQSVLHASSAAAHRVSAEALEAAAVVLRHRNPAAAVRHATTAAGYRAAAQQ